MNKTATIVIIIIIFFLVTALVSAEQQECPEGTFNVGHSKNGPVCRNEPTGCPYGDSIPIDSAKCVAPGEVKQPVIETVEQVQSINKPEIEAGK